jgi:hypothetical protein
MMSDNENRDLFDSDKPPQSELLDELGSLKELLDEEVEQNSAPITSVSEIRSVKEYVQLKQEADEAGLSLEAFLQERAAQTQAPETAPGEEDDIPMLDEVVDLEALPLAEVEETEAAAVAELEEAIPTLDEVYEVAETAASGEYSLEEIERMVHDLVGQKLEEIRPQLEKQIFDQIRSMLPVDLFK